MNKFISLLLILGISAASQAQLLVASERVLPALKGAEVYQSEDQVILVLDGTKMTSMEQVHTIIATALNYPSTYGKNLPSLSSHLSSNQYTRFYVHFVFENAQQMRAQLGAVQYDALVATLLQVKQVSRNLELSVL